MFQAEYTPFLEALETDHQNEQVVAEEFAYHGIEVYRPEGKSYFDFQLPNGQTCEVKLDLRSQRTSHGIIEGKSLQRPVDYFLHTFTYCRVYTAAEYQWLYNHGKIPAKGVGEFGYTARYIPKLEMKNKGIFLDQFIKLLKN